MNGPTHVIKISLSGIQMIFTSPPNLMIEAVVMIFLYASFHHHINYAKFNLNFVYAPPSKREVW